MSRRRALRAAGLALALAAVLVWTVAPYAWIVITSLKPASELARLPPILPTEATLASYAAVLSGEREFPRVLLNSALVATLSTVLCLAVGSLAAFALARLPLRFRGAILALFLSISMFPPIATVSPVYLALKAVGLRDTIPGLVLPYTALGLPLTVWFLTGFLRGTPVELYRAARVDGCTPVAAFRRVLLPVIAPGVVTTAILVFVLSWNELLFALTLTSTAAARTVPVEIALFAGLHEVPWGEIAAASVVSTLPLLAVAFLLQRWLLAGLLSGATKE